MNRVYLAFLSLKQILLTYKSFFCMSCLKCLPKSKLVNDIVSLLQVQVQYKTRKKVKASSICHECILS